MTEDELVLEWLRKRGFSIGVSSSVETGKRIIYPRVSDTEQTIQNGKAVAASDLDFWVSRHVEGRSKGSTTLRTSVDPESKYQLRDVVRLWMLGLTP